MIKFVGNLTVNFFVTNDILSMDKILLVFFYFFYSDDDLSKKYFMVQLEATQNF